MKSTWVNCVNAHGLIASAHVEICVICEFCCSEAFTKIGEKKTEAKKSLGFQGLCDKTDPKVERSDFYTKTTTPGHKKCQISIQIPPNYSLNLVLLRSTTSTIWFPSVPVPSFSLRNKKRPRTYVQIQRSPRTSTRLIRYR